MNASSKVTKDEPKEVLERLDIWHSIDTWDGTESIWEKKQGNVVNPWKAKSTDEIDHVPIKGRPVFPHAKVLGRTPLRWLQLIVFYIIFYSVIFAFSYFCYFIFNHFIRPKDEPMYTDVLTRHRGLSVVPKLLDDYDLRMEYSSESKKDMDNFLKKYSQQSDGVECSFGMNAPSDSYCKFDINQLGPCAPPFEKKCFILKLNRIFNWKPEPYGSSSELPSFMPKDLKNMFESTPRSKRNVVWTSCYIPKKEHKKHVRTLKYHPSHSSFPGYYFPFKNQSKYIDPLVAVEIDVTKGSVIYIKCRNWAKNIDNKNVDVGTIEFKYTVK